MEEATKFFFEGILKKFLKEYFDIFAVGTEPG